MLAARRASTSSRRSATCRSASLRSRPDSQIHVPVHMVGLVGQTAREVPGPLDHERLAVPVEPAHHGPVRTRYVHHGARHRQASLAVVEQPAPGRVELVEHRIDDVSDMPDTVVVRTVVDEEPQSHTDLVRREPRPVRDVHRQEHVVDQRGEIGPELGHVPARPVQHLLADLGGPGASREHTCPSDPYRTTEGPQPPSGCGPSVRSCCPGDRCPRVSRCQSTRTAPVGGS